MKKILSTLIISFVLLSAGINNAFADNNTLDVSFVNKTSTVVMRVKMANNTWGYIKIPSMSTKILSFANKKNQCVFEIETHLSNGKIIKEPLNVCNTHTWTITDKKDK